MWHIMARPPVLLLISLCTLSPTCLVYSGQQGHAKQTDINEEESHFKKDNRGKDAYKNRVQRCIGDDPDCFDPPVVNNIPIIGVLAVESTDSMLLRNGDTHIRSSYVNFLRMGGAAVVPISVGAHSEYYTALLNMINGVIFQGGEHDVASEKYMEAAKMIFNLTKMANDNRDYFPLVAIGLGHEVLATLMDDQDLLTPCDAEALQSPLVLDTDSRYSRLLGTAPKEIIDTLTTNMTTNNHHLCIKPENFTMSELDNIFRIISTSTDRTGAAFVSMMEAKMYPIYSLHWHPEMATYVWDKTLPINRSQAAIRVCQYFANFFVEEARKSEHNFSDLTYEGRMLIKNRRPLYHGPPTYQVNYFFDMAGDITSTLKYLVIVLVVTATSTCLIYRFCKTPEKKERLLV